MMNDGREFPGYWTMDYPRSDRHLLEGVRRLTRIESRSVEQVVSLDGTPEIYNWPVIYAVEVGHWMLPDDQARQLREYLMRGGFLMVDDFHGDREWAVFTASMNRVFPDTTDCRSGRQGSDFSHDLRSQRTFSGPRSAIFRDRSDLREGRDGKIAHWRGISMTAGE